MLLLPPDEIVLADEAWLEDLDYEHLVNEESPLNQGLALWALTLPGLSGGEKNWFFAKGGIGALTNGPTWGGPLGRPGAFGRLEFDGTDDYVSCGVTGLPNIESPKSILFWTTYDTSTDRKIAFSLVKDDTGSASNSVDLEHNSGAFSFLGSPAFRAAAWGGNTYADVVLDSNGANLTSGQWFQLAYTYDGTTHQLYANDSAGVSQTTASQTGATGVCRIGSFNSAFPSPYYNRPLDGILVFNRALSASEVRAWRNEAIQGYRQTINRVRSSARHFAFPALGGGSPSVTPAAAIAKATAIAPTVQLGSLSITPAAAVAKSAGVAPAVRLGSLSLTPTTAAARTAAVAPSVQQASLSITPAPAIARATALAPSVSTGGLNVTPAPATARTVAVAPSVRLSSLSIMPLAAIVRAVCAAPTVAAGGAPAVHYRLLAASFFIPGAEATDEGISP